MATARDVGVVEMWIAKVVGFAAPDDEMVYCVVLGDVAGDRHLPSRLASRRPSTRGSPERDRVASSEDLPFAAALVQAVGRRVRQVRIERLTEEPTPPPSR
jgi:hypothetical protein